jgi:WD40 repeat protein
MRLARGPVVVVVALACSSGWCQADKEKPKVQIEYRVSQNGRPPDIEGGLKTTADGKLGVKVQGLTARVYDLATGKPFGPPLRHKDSFPNRKMEITAWAFSPDGALLATGLGDPSSGTTDTEGEVFVWEVATGKRIHTTGKHRSIGRVTGLAFSGDGRTVVVACLDESGK